MVFLCRIFSGSVSWFPQARFHWLACTFSHTNFLLTFTYSNNFAQFKYWFTGLLCFTWPTFNLFLPDWEGFFVSPFVSIIYQMETGFSRWGIPQKTGYVFVQATKIYSKWTIKYWQFLQDSAILMVIGAFFAPIFYARFIFWILLTIFVKFWWNA